MKYFFNFMVFWFFVSSASTGRADQMATVQSLLAAFGGSCSIQGAQSRRLNETAQTLAMALTAMKASPECAGLNTIATGVQGSLDRMSFLAPQFSYEEKEYQRLRERKSALVQALFSETDPTALADLQSRLRETEIQLVEAEQYWNLEKVNEKNERFWEAANSYRSASDSLMRGLVNNAECMDHHPGVGKEIGRIGLALAQSGTLGMATSGISVIAGAGIYTANRLIQHIKEEKNARALRRFSDPMVAPSLGCALEALNEIYCESEKTEKLGRFMLSPEMDISRRDAVSAFAGLELLEKALPSLETSLTLMKIGSDPSSANDALGRMGINTLKVLLQTSKGILFGSLNDLKRQADAISPDLSVEARNKQIFRIQKQFVSNFLNYVQVPDNSNVVVNGDGSSSVSGGGPLATVHQGQVARYFLMGFSAQKINKAQNDPSFLRFDKLEIESFYTGDDSPWVKYGLESKGGTHFVPDMGVFQAQVQERFNGWYKEAQDVLDTQSNLVLKTDKKEILASFDKPISRDYKLTPIVAMQKLVGYITNPENVALLPDKYKNIANEVAKVIETEVVAKVNSASFDLPEEEFQKKANEVFGSVLIATRYDDDTQFFLNRLNILINLIVKEASLRFYESGNPDIIYALASTDVVKELKSFSMRSTEPADMILQAAMTQGQAIDQVGAFVEGFKEPLKRVLKELAKPENLTRRAVERAHLCLQLLGFDQNKDPKFFKNYILRYCEGAAFPEIPRVPKSPMVTSEILEKPVEERICAHQNWRRRLVIFDKGFD